MKESYDIKGFKATDIRHIYPVKASNPAGQAFGVAFDNAVTLLSHQYGDKDRLSTCQTLFEEKFDSLVRELGLSVAEKQKLVDRGRRMLQAFLQAIGYLTLGSKPKTLAFACSKDVRMFCQPDMTTTSEVYELKSYPLSSPLQPDIKLQLKLFGLAYPHHKLFAVGFKEGQKGEIEVRFVRVQHFRKPPLTKLAAFGREHGEPMEHIEVDTMSVPYAHC